MHERNRSRASSSFADRRASLANSSHMDSTSPNPRVIARVRAALVVRPNFGVEPRLGGGIALVNDHERFRLWRKRYRLLGDEGLAVEDDSDGSHDLILSRARV